MGEYISEKKIPEGWIMAPPFGDLIKAGNTFFVPMKSPFGSKWNECLFSRHQFLPSTIAFELNKKGKKLATIFSFANSNNRYDKNDLHVKYGSEPYDIKQIWIRCGKDAPDDSRYRAFLNGFSNLKLTTNDVVGIHCTHGFNRTGFIIVRYLVEEQGMSLINALEEFKRARPPGIYKADYVDKLFEIYNQENVWDTPIGTKASWSFPDPSLLPHFVQRETIKLDTEDAPIVGQPVNLFMNAKLTNAILEMCNKNPSHKNFPGSQPVTLAASNESSLSNDPTYHATYKSDGTRYFMLAEREKTYIVDRKLEFHEVNVILVDRRGNRLKHTLLDGELVSEEISEGKNELDDDVVIPENKMNFLIFDIIEFEGLNLIENNWDTRMDYVEKGVIAFRKMWQEKRPDLFLNEEFRISLKKQWPLNQLNKLQKYVKHRVLHPTDGIIFTPLSMKYIMGQCNQILKWKPIELNSADFICLEKNGIHYLAVRISYSQNRGVTKKAGYSDIPISILDSDPQSILSDFNSKIVECSYDVTSHAWFPLRVRTDKTAPNAYSTFVKICISIEDDITVEKLQQRFGIDNSEGYS